MTESQWVRNGSASLPSRLLWLGYFASVGLFIAAIILICQSGPSGYDYDTPAAVVIGKINIDLLNRSRYAGRDSIDYALESYVVIYNNEGPYFGSILGLPVPTTDHRSVGPGLYYRWLSWAAGDYWVTLRVSLWWLLVVSLALPFIRAFGQFIYCPRFSLWALVVAMTIACVLCALPNPLALLHPVYLTAGMSLMMAVRYSYRIARHLRRFVAH